MEQELTRGIELVEAAMEHEEAGDLAKALASYTSAIEHLLLHRKYERNKAKSAILTDRIKSYTERAEKLKELIDRGPPPPAPAPVASARSAAGEDSGARLRTQAEALILDSALDVKWDQVAGLSDAKEALKQAVVWPQHLPQLFESGRVEAWSGILLYGPPGTGKTMLAKAVATESRARTFMHVSVAAIMSKWVGESEGMIRAVFQVARERTPAVVFIDEVDAVAGRRSENDHDVSRKVKNQLLAEMDGLVASTRVLVLAATNMPWELDQAFLRRLQRRILIPLPDGETRRQLIGGQLARYGDGVQLSDDDRRWLVTQTDGWSGSDIATLVKTAGNHQMNALSRATHFAIIGTGDAARMVPCPPDADDAVEVTLDEIIARDQGSRVALPPVKRGDFEWAFSVTRPAKTDDSDLDKLRAFETT